MGLEGVDVHAAAAAQPNIKSVQRYVNLSHRCSYTQSHIAPARGAHEEARPVVAAVGSKVQPVAAAVASKVGPAVTAVASTVRPVTATVASKVQPVAAAVASKLRFWVK